MARRPMGPRRHRSRTDHRSRRRAGMRAGEGGLGRIAQVLAVSCFGIAAASGYWSAARAAPSPAPSTTASATAPTIEVIDYAFTPPSLTVAPGSTVVFRNGGRATHRVVAEDGSFDSRGLQPGGTWSLRVGAGSTIVAYRCAIHPSMTGELVVSSSLFEPLAGVPTTTARTGANTPVLASTGDQSRLLAIVGVTSLLLGGLALFVARPVPVRIRALGPLYADDLIPVRDGARR